MSLSTFIIFSTADAVFVGTVLLPHGDFALDPTFIPSHETKERTIANSIASASRRAGSWLIDQTEPDILFLTTPHGIKLDYDYGIYMSNTGSGYATIGKDAIISDQKKRGKLPYNVSLSNIDLAPVHGVGEDLLKWLQHGKNHPVSGIYSYNDDTPMPLSWGEIIPLLLLPSWNQSDRHQSSIRPPPPKPLIWTFPYRRYDHAPDMVEELLSIGGDIMTWIQLRPERIGVVISGDLSHTHLSNGPYGYSAASTMYDNAIGQWLNSSLSDLCNDANVTAALLERARALQPNAKSCGFTGYVVWHGMMCHTKTSITSSFRSKLLSIGNVTYYGMASAISWDANDKIQESFAATIR
jgi:aromatic ring-opening dioxygenase LigB subunit